MEQLKKVLEYYLYEMDFDFQNNEIDLKKINQNELGIVVFDY